MGKCMLTCALVVYTIKAPDDIVHQSQVFFLLSLFHHTLKAATCNFHDLGNFSSYKDDL